jgi:hypothetical protein
MPVPLYEDEITNAEIFLARIGGEGNATIATIKDDKIILTNE